MIWLRRNLVLIIGALMIIIVGAINFAPTEPASLGWWIVVTLALAACAGVDHRRLCANIRSGRDRLWPRT